MKRTTRNPEKTSFISLLVISSLVFVPLSAAAGHNSEANQKDQSRGASDGHEASRGKEAKPDPHQTNPGSRWPGVGISVDLSRLFGGQKKAPDLPKMLDKEGPQFPDVYNMSDFSIEAYAKGNWPMVIDFELEQQSVVLLTIMMEGVEPFYYHLNGNTLARHQEKLTIPTRFGDAAKPATYSIRGLSAVVGEAKPVFLRLFGIGAGPKAVGSLKIDELRFQPGKIRPQQKEKASFSFHSHEDFTKAEAEFWQVGRIANGPIIPRRVDVEKIKNIVRRDERVSSSWQGKGNGKPVTGQFQLQVCAWVEGRDGGDWATALSPELVIVE